MDDDLLDPLLGLRNSTWGYKKIKCKNLIISSQSFFSHEYDCLATLLIPEEARIIKPYNDNKKFRTDMALVVKIEPIDSTSNIKKKMICNSIYDKTFQYEEGKIVTPCKPLNTDRIETCKSGIHFFMDKNSAKNYF